LPIWSCQQQPGGVNPPGFFLGKRIDQPALAFIFDLAYTARTSIDATIIVTVDFCC